MTGPVDGSDFASAAMMRLVAAGLSRQGIPIPLPASTNAHVPLTAKRDVLGGVLARHGPLAVLSIADAARSMPPEPVVQALARSRDMADLMDRWHRLERFSHGRHKVQTEVIGANSFRLTHHARDDGPPPTLAESLLVIALLTVLAEMIGSTDVMLADTTGAVWRRHGKWQIPDMTRGIGSANLIATSKPRAAGITVEGLERDPVSNLRLRLVADPVRRWTVASLAAETGASARTLQRRLTERSVSFSRLVAEARVEVAASHLCKSDGPTLAEIAFIAGFADQAHFTRTFSRVVGTAPGGYRSDFGQ
jgi:AraC-like DNA-binding protein